MRINRISGILLYDRENPRMEGSESDSKTLGPCHAPIPGLLHDWVMLRQRMQNEEGLEIEMRTANIER